MKLWLTAVCSLLLVFVAPIFSAQALSDLRIPQARSTNDTAHSYFTELLKAALLKAANGRKVPQLMPVLMPMSTERKIHELRLKRSIDIFWLGGSQARARDLLMVPIPFDRGLVGYR